MDSRFFAALAVILVVPALVGRLARLDRFVPLVFLQLLFGALMHMANADGWLRAQGLDLLHGPLANSLHGLGWLGISLLIALTAAESSPADSDARPRQFVTISVLGFFSTWVLGALLGWRIAVARPEWVGARADASVFALGVGLSLAVTALPVLVAILRQSGLYDTAIGRLAARCAVLDDLWLWLGMAVVLSAGAADGNALPRTLLLLAAYAVLMLLPVRKLLRWWFARHHPAPSAGSTLLACAAVVFLSAMATDLIGVHAVFGAFVGGAVLPREALQPYRHLLLQFVHVLLLPLFFVLTGMQLELATDGTVWLLAAIFSTVGVVGKLLVVAASARGLGMSLRDSLALGSLMQCKGMMEIVAITMLHDAGIIESQVFSALALVAVISTAVCLPLVRLTLRPAPGSLAAPA